MGLHSKILKRWTYVCFLLIIQLATGILPTYAAHQRLYFQEIKAREAREDYLENLVSRLPQQLEADDDTPDCIHATKHRRKTRYYISASSQQFSIATRVAYIDAGIAQSSYTEEEKTGEYVYQKAFRPAYYSFLFRLTPF
ncbi:MAG TPA: hypothetical protein VM802_19545 [Chitinophaga sp.]|uniref:hypothetical protein n=1 Tax=Chitinophaga sp. TaxID=1869181 RepID=UPI002B5A60AD|nr:hypothetical protein [Chitinophaga sp.]HVI47080.1 hypothetical protein [Chitinophaga sp.]